MKLTGITTYYIVYVGTTESYCHSISYSASEMSKDKDGKVSFQKKLAFLNVKMSEECQNKIKNVEGLAKELKENGKVKLRIDIKDSFITANVKNNIVYPYAYIQDLEIIPFEKKEVKTEKKETPKAKGLFE